MHWVTRRVVTTVASWVVWSVEKRVSTMASTKVDGLAEYLVGWRVGQTASEMAGLRVSGSAGLTAYLEQELVLWWAVE